MRHLPGLPPGDLARWWLRTGKLLTTYLALALVAAINLLLILIAKPTVGSFLWVVGVLFGIYCAIGFCAAVFIVAVIFGIPQRLFLAVLPDDDEPHGPESGP